MVVFMPARKSINKRNKGKAMRFAPPFEVFYGSNKKDGRVKKILMEK